MADNSTQGGSDLIRDIQKGGGTGPKSQVVVIDRGGSGAEDLTPLDGTDISSPQAMPFGGVGIRGWLSAIYTKLFGQLRVSKEVRTSITFRGRVASPRTPGRAGTAGQKLFAIYLSSGGPSFVDIESVMVDYYATAAKTVAPPALKLFRVTAAPTGGTGLNLSTNRIPFDTGVNTPDLFHVLVLSDASGDGTSSGTALAATGITNGSVANLVSQVFTPRNLTLVGYEGWDRWEFLDGEDEAITLRPGEGLVLFLDYAAATQNPITDQYSVVCQFTEYGGVLS